MPNQPYIPPQIVPIIKQASEQYKLPPEVLTALLAKESIQFQPQYITGYHTDGTGRGIAGIDKNAHPEVTDQQAFDPEFSINWMANMLSRYRDAEGGNLDNALRRYNGGPGYASDRMANSQIARYRGRTVADVTNEYLNNIKQQAQAFAGALGVNPQPAYASEQTPAASMPPGTPNYGTISMQRGTMTTPEEDRMKMVQAPVQDDRPWYQKMISPRVANPTPTPAPGMKFTDPSGKTTYVDKQGKTIQDPASKPGGVDRGVQGWIIDRLNDVFGR